MTFYLRRPGWVGLWLCAALLGCQHTPPPLPVGLDGQPLTLNQHHLYVNGELERSWPDRHTFHTLHAAVAAASEGTEAQPTYIYIAPDVYWMNGTETDRGLYIDKDWVHLVGLSEDPHGVVLADNRGHTIGAYSTAGSSPAETLFVTGTGFAAENLTIGNYCNVDLVYPSDPRENRAKRSNTITQAYAIGAASDEQALDRFVFRNVRFIGMLDTLALADVERAYFDEVYVQGTDDFIGGGQMHVFEHSVIRSYSSKPLVTAGHDGTAFIDSRWEVVFEDPGELWLSKRSSTFFLNNVDFVDRTGHLQAIHWSPYPEPGINSYQYGVTLNGAPYRLLPKASGVPLSDEQAAAYTSAHLLAGTDGWNPTGDPLDAELARAPLDIRVSGPESLRPEDGPATLSANTFPVGATADIRWSATSNAIQLEPVGPSTVRITTRYEGEASTAVPVTATAGNGIENHRVLTLHPAELSAPMFIRAPALSIREDGKVEVDYELDLAFAGGTRPDRSRVTWYRLAQADESGPIPVAVTRGDKPLRHYSLTQSDVGHHLMARVAPAHNRSEPGEAQSALTARAIRIEDVPEAAREQVTLNVEQSPVARQPERLPHTWTRDTHYPADQSVNWEARPVDAWRYGSGINGAEGRRGLMPDAQGARLLYTLNQHSGGMQVELSLATEKTAAQGFGSPNGQYLEVYIKYDTRTRTGYALRIERTTKYAFATDFTLYRYEQGLGTPISESISATAFNPNTRIVLNVEGEQLSAVIRSDYPQSSEQKEAGLPTEVTLQASITPEPVGGFGLQHTGTVGPGGRFILQSLSAYYRD